MNQAIQVLDGFIYIEATKAIQIEVMAGGQMLLCYITGEDKQNLSTLYAAKQFEIEELIEGQIAQDYVNEKGEIWLTTHQVNTF